MARRNKKVIKLRAYRDNLLAQITNLETVQRTYQKRMWLIREALRENDSLRAYALATDEDARKTIGLDDVKLNDAIGELALVYRMLNVEGEYTHQIDKAIEHNDWLRAKALCHEHKEQRANNDKLLSRWGLDNGFTRKWRKEDEEST